jgi:hypothetical protein
MLNLFSRVLSDAASRNPVPLLVFSLVFFGGIAISFLDKPPSNSHYDYEASERRIARSAKAQEQAMDYCAEKNLPQYTPVFITVDKERLQFSCGLQRKAARGPGRGS